MANIIEVTCANCGHKWEMDYDALQRDYRRVDKNLGLAKKRREEYAMRCPNPKHNEEIVISVEVEE